MPRTKITKRNRQQLRMEADIDEGIRMAAVKLDSTLEQIDALTERYKLRMKNQLQLILTRTPQQLLQLKWTEFLKLDLQRFYQFELLAPTPVAKDSSRCTQSRTAQKSQLLRIQTNSVARAMPQGREWTAQVAFLRWPKPGEVALSQSGSPLAVQSLEDRRASVQIPTKSGVLKLQPQELLNVKSEVLKQLDQATLNQIKTLHSNLDMIVDMATKLGKL
ncbi:borealin [Drosophila busckii]|uniref:borealin n=1 Tax=Drosophila busckii TaxID=30019 RepID=UPI00083F2C23|nr:borealin [Drosophila busckii]